MWIKLAPARSCDGGDVADPFAAFAALCSPAAHGSVLAGAGMLAMASLGAMGSVTHCAPMCGPIVGGQVMHRLACLPCARLNGPGRLRQGILAPYHIGRIITYAALGALAGGLGMGAEAALRPMRGALLLLAACGFLLAAWRRTRSQAPHATMRFNTWANPVLRHLRPGSLPYGLALGLLPCGLVYLALLAACTTGSPLWGAAYMAAFGAGTVPVLALVGIGSHFAPGRLRKLAPVLLACNGAVLAVSAISGVFI